MLHDTYGSPRHGNKDDPLDELVFFLLPQMTSGSSFNRVCDRIRGPTRPGTRLATPLDQVKAVIKDAGLSGQKPPSVKTIFQKLRDDFAAVTLAPLGAMTDAETDRDLTGLPRVGVKTGRCVLMYSLGRRVLPVDTHVWRVTRRLGLVGEDVPFPKVHDAPEAVVAPEDRYSIHVNGVAHCRGRLHRDPGPRRASYPLKAICPYPPAAAQT